MCYGHKKKDPDRIRYARGYVQATDIAKYKDAYQILLRALLPLMITTFGTFLKLLLMIFVDL
ncbi:hypothetical protein, partial [Photobacterium sp. R1]